MQLQNGNKLLQIGYKKSYTMANFLCNIFLTILKKYVKFIPIVISWDFINIKNVF